MTAAEFDLNLSRMRLPPNWEIQFLGAEAVVGTKVDSEGPIALILSALDAPADSVSGLFARRGLNPWGRSSFPLGPVTIQLGRYPNLDEVWTLFLWALIEGFPEAIEVVQRQLEPLTHYVEAARKGHRPDAEPIEHALRMVYLQILHDTLVGDHRDEQRFLGEVMALLAAAAGEVIEGHRPQTEDLLGRHTRFTPYFERLREDRDRYREARGKGSIYVAQAPWTDRGQRRTREVALLVLPEPTAVQFATWARSDPDAPLGKGFPLLVAEEVPGQIVISADPSSRLEVSFLAPILSEAEAATRGEPHPWFDGRDKSGHDRFTGTICAHPNGGTALSIGKVVELLKPQLSLRVPGRKFSRRGVFIAACVLVLALGVLATKVVSVDDTGLTGSREPGEEAMLGRGEVRALVANPEGPRSLARFALLIGATYSAEEELARDQLIAPGKDVEALRRVLIEDYAYRPENVIVISDQGDNRRVDLRVSRKDISKVIKELRIGPRSSFLFYYSGHGETDIGADGKSFGWLRFPGSQARQTDQNLRWQLDRILEDLDSEVASRHLMVVLDCCYSGFAGVMNRDELIDGIRHPWDGQARVVLTAGRSGERVEGAGQFRDGLSLFTSNLVDALRLSSHFQRAQADFNDDGIVTDEEIARHVIDSTVGEYQHPVLARPNSSKQARFFFLPDRDQGR